MIRAVSWFCSDHHGSIVPGGASWSKPSPSADTAAKILALIDRPVKYYGRLTDDARASLCAASIARRAADWSASEIGVISAGFDATLKANQDYFRDYVETGRTMGRGNLFIYTLPTSAIGEVAIALSLTGPCLYLESETKPFSNLIRRAERLIADGEADGMLVLWCDRKAAACVAVDGTLTDHHALDFLHDGEWTPTELLLKLQPMVRGS